MFKLLLVVVALALVVGRGAARPQLLLDYGYYPGYVPAYSAPLAYSYPLAYTYSYPLAYF